MLSASQRVLRDEVVVSARIGACKPAYLMENAKAVSMPTPTIEESSTIDTSPNS